MDRHIAKVWELEFPSPTLKFVALCVARLSVRSGLCWAKQKTIAADTGFAVKTVNRALADLEELGWISRAPFRKQDGGRGADRIWLTLPEVTLSPDVPDFRNPFGADHDGDSVSPPSDSVSPKREPSVGRVRSQSPSKSGNPSGEEGEDARDAHDLSEALAEGIDVDAAVEVIWTGVGDNGRRRSSKAKVKKALSAALSKRRRGSEPAEERLRRILMGVRAYLSHPDTRKEGGKFEHGAHRTLQDDVWESYLDDGGARSARGDGAAPDPALGNAEEPGPALQRFWMERDREGLPWHPERGPRPGMPGCRVDGALQREFGYTPWAPPEDDDDAAAFA